MLKSLLTSCVAIAASLAAVAAPQVAITPTPGKTFDSNQYFATFNLTPDGSYSVAADAYATLECLDTGDIFYSTSFADFRGVAIIVNFDCTEITENGEYEFVVPAGSLTVGGEANEKLTATYTLNDPTLNIGQYPQISLVSSTPADGAEIAAIGAEALNRVTFVTSDDSAVNYIGWSLWDVTNPDDPSYVYSGSENRIDFNRNGSLDDVWANGLYISIGGPDQYLYKGHTYKFSATFCGIGYDPETNQYPNPTQIAQSTELEIEIFFTGLTNVTEYSPYTYESVSPDPATYEIEYAEQAVFSITYSGPVIPDTFIYHRAMGDTPVAGTFAPVGDADMNGCASAWEFTVFPEIASTLAGMANFQITTKDADGLYVKGNNGEEMNNYVYSVSYESTVGLPDLISVSPSVDSVVDSLSEIVVTNSESQVMAFSYNATQPARILDLSGAEVRVLGEPTCADNDETKMVWQFDPISEAGSYILVVPKYYFAIGEQFEGSTSKQTFFRYFVDNSQPSTGAVYDLEPIAVTPADGSVVVEITSVVLTFADVTFYPMSEGAPVATLVNTSSNHEVIYTSEPAVKNDFFNPTEYTFTFATPITEVGVYNFIVSQGAFCDETYDMEMGETGHACPELVYTFTIDYMGVGTVAADSVADVYGIDGKVILRNASAADLKKLPAGLYIFNGKKIIVR